MGIEREANPTGSSGGPDMASRFVFEGAAGTACGHLVLVSYYFPPMGMSGVQRAAHLARGLCRTGWRVTVVTIEPRGYFAFDQGLLDSVVASGVKIVRTRSLDPASLFGVTRTIAQPSEGSRRLFAGLTASLFLPDNKVAWRLSAPSVLEHVATPVDAVLSTAPPYSGHLLAVRLAREWDAPLTVDFRDDWVGNPRHHYPTRWHRARHLTLERRVLQAAKEIITVNADISGAMAARHHDLFSDGRRPPTVVPHGFDPADFSGDHATTFPRELELLYSGVFYHAQQPDTFLSGLYEFYQRRPEARHLVRATFVGLLPESGKRLARQLGIDDRIEHLGYLDHRACCERLCRADALWLTVGEQLGGERITPGKLADYLGARKPILALVPPGSTRRRLESHGAAWIVDPADTLGTATAIEDIYRLWREGALPQPDDEVVRAVEMDRLTAQVSDLLTRSLRRTNG